MKKALKALETVGLKAMKLNIQQKCQEVCATVGLARALANDPGVLLMDEAFSALDPLIKSDMQDELLHTKQVAQNNRFITHEMKP
jgi:glycine betaine/proline transport system ATP-binding protein